MYSRPSDLKTSIMNSDPGRSVVKTSALAGLPVSAAFDIIGTEFRAWAEGCAFAALPATSVATLPAAAVFKKLRRSTEVILDFAMQMWARASTPVRCFVELRILTVDLPHQPVSHVAAVLTGRQIGRPSLCHGVSLPSGLRASIESKQTSAVQTEDRSFSGAVGWTEQRISILLLHVLWNFQPAQCLDLPLRRTEPERVRAPDHVVRSQTFHQHPHHSCCEARITDAAVREHCSHVRIYVADAVLLRNLHQIGNPVNAARLLEMRRPHLRSTLHGWATRVAIARVVDKEI